MSTTDTIICPNCHKDNQFSAKHCRHCGHVLSNGSSSSIPNIQVDAEATASSLAQQRVPPAPKPIVLSSSTSASPSTPTSPLPPARPRLQQSPSLSPQSAS